MLNKHWEEFYSKNEAPDIASSFCRFVLDKKLEGNMVVDLGCGNGRDTKRLAQSYKEVYGIDPAIEGNIDDRLIKSDWQSKTKLIENADIVYSRFFLHSIDDEEIATIIRLTNGYFCAEARAIGDKPLLYPEHRRNFVDGSFLLWTLIDNGFDILYFEKSKGLAVYKNEDPLIIRVIANK